MEEKKLKLNLKYLCPGCRLIYPLYSSQDKVILDERIVLTERKINEIQKQYGDTVYYYVPEEQSSVSKRCLDNALNKSREIMNEISRTEKLKKSVYDEAEKVIGNIINELESSELSAINLLKDLKTHEEYLYQHSVNVGVLSAIFAKTIGSYTPEQIKCLTLGAYLLDIGAMKIDRELLRKKGKYDSSDRLKIKQHPQFGYEIIKNIPGIDPVILQTILFHHEKYNNRGYFQLPFDVLPPLPKIVAVCDMYDALTTKRPYRDALSPTGALKYLVNSININFEYDLISKFVNNLGPILSNTQSFYTINDFCELNTNELAIIKNFNNFDYLKPKILVFCKFRIKDKKIAVQFYDSPIEVDLMKDEKRLLTKIITNRKLINTIKTKLIQKNMTYCFS